MREKRSVLICIGFWWESQKERDHYEDPDTGRRIILKCILDIMGQYVLDSPGSG
jgi:hypothetical protein